MTTTIEDKIADHWARLPQEYPFFIAPGQEYEALMKDGTTSYLVSDDGCDLFDAGVAIAPEIVESLILMGDDL